MPIIPTPERKALSIHPPPPTRTIALGDKLPPTRRQTSGSSSSESEEEEPKVKVDQLPDFSRSSRRPPLLSEYATPRYHMHVPAYSGLAVLSGHTLAVFSHRRLKIYNLVEADSPMYDLDAKAIGLETVKELKITSMAFRSVIDETDGGRFLWLGLKEGHLIEVDVWAGVVTGMKFAAHGNPITHIFRYKWAMMSMDDGGKVLVYNSDPDNREDVALPNSHPRIVRTAAEQEFVQIFGQQLWTSVREPNGTALGATARSPVIRIYDLFIPGSSGKSVLPSEHLGAVTSGTYLPSQPGKIYLGHEGGYISIWTQDGTEDGLPFCEEVVRVSTSDVTALLGVNDRLWAGGRKGAIAAYDVSARPWIATNFWSAHDNLPVLKLEVDSKGIMNLDRYCVYSIGRDERLRFWDGLLGIDWIEQETLKREEEFSSFRDLKVLTVSWNVDSAKPDALIGTPDNVNFLENVLKSVDSPDIISFGLQEVIDLESRKMAAKTVLLGGRGKSTDGSISQRVTTSYKKWYDRLVLAVRLAMSPDTPYTVIHTENLVGLFTCIFVKNSERVSLKHNAITTVKRGMGGRYGNKGGIVARFVIDDSSICFINCHLAAGQSHVRQRNGDIAAMLEDKCVFPQSDSAVDTLAYVNGGDGTMVLDHEIVFLNGDMNYRIDMRRDAVVSSVQAGNLNHLQSQDQLLKEMKNNRGFRLRSFQEGPLNFSPTYKYDRGSNEYDSSEKRRIPAWCDRILWRSLTPSRVNQLHYQRYETNISDHRPISAAFAVTVKSLHHEARERVLGEMKNHWVQHEKELLYSARDFYLSH
ncbi:DNase I-like protein [Abortiporus biennis]|nr:DNase I-like protein [Abortiporus biennis]